MNDAYNKLNKLFNPYSNVDKDLFEAQCRALHTGLYVPLSFFKEVIKNSPNAIKMPTLGMYLDIQYQLVLTSGRHAFSHFSVEPTAHKLPIMFSDSDMFDVTVYHKKDKVTSYPMSLIEIDNIDIHERPRFMSKTYSHRTKEKEFMLHIKLTDKSLEERYALAETYFGNCQHTTLNLRPIHLLQEFVTLLLWENEEALRTHFREVVALWGLELSLDWIRAASKSDFERVLNNLPFQDFGFKDLHFLRKYVPDTILTHSPVPIQDSLDKLREKEKLYIKQTEGAIHAFEELKKTWSKPFI